MTTLCFLLERTEMVEVSLRRHVTGRCAGNPGAYSYHNAHKRLGYEIPSREMVLDRNPIALDDPRWPTLCEGCGYVFKDSDAKQYFTEPVYRRIDTGELMTLDKAPVGAIWYADSFNDYYESMRGPDGLTMIVRSPGGDWCLDARANNCDSPCKNCGTPYLQHLTVSCGAYQDSKPNHRCWVRHGQAPHIHVDKDGETCGAGSGSYIGYKNNWHGFLHHGLLTP